MLVAVVVVVVVEGNARLRCRLLRVFDVSIYAIIGVIDICLCNMVRTYVDLIR